MLIHKACCVPANCQLGSRLQPAPSVSSEQRLISWASWVCRIEWKSHQEKWFVLLLVCFVRKLRVSLPSQVWVTTAKLTCFSASDPQALYTPEYIKNKIQVKIQLSILNLPLKLDFNLDIIWEEAVNVQSYQLMSFPFPEIFVPKWGTSTELQIKHLDRDLAVGWFHCTDSLGICYTWNQVQQSNLICFKQNLQEIPQMINICWWR